MHYKFTAHKHSGLLILNLISHLIVISICSELLSDVCSLAAGCGEPSSTDVHIYYSCHSLPLSVSPTLSSHHSPRLPVAVSLFISPSVTNLHHLPVSNFPFSPPFRYSLAVALCLFPFSYIPTVFLRRAPLFLSPSVSVTLSGLLPSSPASLSFSALCMLSL